MSDNPGSSEEPTLAQIPRNAEEDEDSSGSDASDDSSDENEDSDESDSESEDTPTPEKTNRSEQPSKDWQAAVLQAANKTGQIKLSLVKILTKSNQFIKHCLLHLGSDTFSDVDKPQEKKSVTVYMRDNGITGGPGMSRVRAFRVLPLQSLDSEDANEGLALGDWESKHKVELRKITETWAEKWANSEEAKVWEEARSARKAPAPINKPRTRGNLVEEPGQKKKKERPPQKSEEQPAAIGPKVSKKAQAPSRKKKKEQSQPPQKRAASLEPPSAEGPSKKQKKKKQPEKIPESPVWDNDTIQLGAKLGLDENGDPLDPQDVVAQMMKDDFKNHTNFFQLQSEVQLSILEYLKSAQMLATVQRLLSKMIDRTNP